MMTCAKFCGIAGLLLVLAVPAPAQTAEAEPARGEAATSFPDPARSRLLVGPTARSIGTWSGYGALFEVFFPYAAVGVGRGVTLGGGISLLPGLDEQLVYVAPKLTLVEREQAALALGVVATTITGQDQYAGVVYGVSTFGDADRALTVAIGLGFEEERLFDHLGVMIGGEYRIAESVKLLTENYLLADESLLLSGGVRLLSPRFTGDLGLITSPEAFEQEGFPFVPWLGFNVHFGRR